MHYAIRKMIRVAFFYCYSESRRSAIIRRRFDLKATLPLRLRIVAYLTANAYCKVSLLAMLYAPKSQLNMAQACVMSAALVLEVQ